MTNTTTSPAAPAARYTEAHVVTLLKTPGRRLDESGIKSNIETMIAGTLTAGRVNRGWSAHIIYRPINTEDTDGDMSRIRPLSDDETFYDYRYVPETAHSGRIEYRVRVAVDLDADRERDSVRVELEGLLTTLHARGEYHKWSVSELDGEPFTIKGPRESVVSSVVVGGKARAEAADMIGYAPCVVPKNWPHHFRDLYGIDDQINMMRSALDRAMQTGFARRFHSVLIGPPGCGKSAMLRAMKVAVGEESVMEFDATATTAAGAIETLGDYEELPRILIVEEIEKAATDTFQFLLGLMDDRSEVRKITAKKKIVKETKLLVFATCNDEDMLARAQAGALRSRFSNPIYFNRPNRDLMAKILNREVQQFGGSETWIEPALDLADALDIADPRRIIAMMSLGGNDLITGEYQRRLLTVGMAHQSDPDESIESVRGKLARLVAQIKEGA